MKRAGLLLAFVLLAGCGGSRTTQVGAEMILPPMAPQMKMQSQEAFFMAEHLNPELLPDYPEALLEKGPEQATVCVEIVVDADGTVSWTAPLRAGPRCPAEALPALAWFEHAVDRTVRQWRFEPASVCTFPAGVEKNYDCIGEGVVRKTIPLRLAFVFDFSRSERRGRFSGTASR